jgi:hypothetical protein
MLIINSKIPLIPGINEDPRQFNSNVKDDIFLSTSHSTSANANLAANLQYYNTYNQSAQILFCPQSLTRAAQSAETYFLSSHAYARRQAQARPKALTNPFAPASIRIRMVPGRRRWAHAFPIGKINFLISS